MEIHDIAWPDDPGARVHACLRYACEVVRRGGIAFPPDMPDPVTIATGYVHGTTSPAAYRLAASPWWDFIDENGLLTDFEATPALVARIAISLLSVEESTPSALAERLAWFADWSRKASAGRVEPLGVLDDFFDSVG